MKSISEAAIHKAYLILGANVGDREQHLQRAADAITTDVGAIIRKSAIYETDPWGNVYQQNFYNQVLLIKTSSNAKELLNHLLDIEQAMGRIRTVKNAARNIDIDILFYDDAIINEHHLTIPHKEIANRRFVLAPMAAIAPGFVHPVLQKTMQELLLECKDTLQASILQRDMAHHKE